MTVIVNKFLVDRGLALFAIKKNILTVDRFVLTGVKINMTITEAILINF